MDNKYSYLNKSKYEINFMINQDNIILYLRNPIEKESLNNKYYNEKLPKNKIFRINSLIFNEEKQIEEINNIYDCIYNDINNVLYIIINEKDNYKNFTKNKLLNILDFSISLCIKEISLLISKKNKQYLNILQDMIVVGFSPEDNSHKISIDEKEYKILKMNVKDICQEIKEITLI